MDAMDGMTNEEAFKLGYEAKSIFENPFKQDSDFARHWVDGYVKKLNDENSSL